MRSSEAELKELKNGRLAMLAYAGYSCAAVSTGKGPLEALSYHLADPFSNNVSVFLCSSCTSLV